jgi:hypothetical protein
MRSFLRPTLGISTILLIVAAGAWQALGLPTPADAEPTTAGAAPQEKDWGELLRLPEFLRSIEECQARRNALDADREAVDRHIQSRVQIVQDVVAGRLGLAMGVRRFRELEEANPYFDPEGFRRSFAGDTDEERHCRHMIEFLRNHARELPAGAQDIADRLEADLQRPRDPWRRARILRRALPLRA